ncbi:MAG: DUF1566 domain-containing protein [Nitrospirae bacterium]|nr:DUF1566 domain-containing protein [Nitrospirota bacterium]
MLKRVVLVVMIFLLLLPVTVTAGTVSLPQTGQSTGYVAGDDGTLRKGVAWPSPRFSDNGDQTVTDNLTGLVWTKDAGTPTVGSCTGGKMTWQAALDYVACLNAATALGHTDWRLPNINELESLVHLGQADSSAWLGLHGFTNVQTDTYWSSTTFVHDTATAWLVHFIDGDVFFKGKSDVNLISYAWPVRSGSSGAFANAGIWATGQTTIYVSNDDGSLHKGVAWPSPRFTDNGNQTVTDNLTGLMWTKNANLPGGYMTWQQGINYVATMNNGTGTYGYTDWRLPNRKELISLIDWSRYNPPLPLNHPFANVQSGVYWSSTTYVGGTAYAWCVDMFDNDTYTIDKNDFVRYVWPVRAGEFNVLTISKSGTGTGTVTSSSSDINCGTTCSASFIPGAVVTLTATTDAGSVFAGWSGDCTGTTSTCTVTMSAAKNVTATFDPPPKYTLIVTKSGSGSGTVSPSTGTLNWSNNTGTAAYDMDTSVTLTATANAGSTFAGWSGDCTGTTSTCTIKMSAAKNVTATFDPTPKYTLTVTKSGSGTGTVSPSTGILNWSNNTATTSYDQGTSISLTANADVGSTFTGWSGDCTGTDPICTVTMSAAKNVTATFDAAPKYTLTVSKIGTGTGTLTASPAGVDATIDCGTTCSATYYSGTTITLTATAAKHSIVDSSSWTGCTTSYGNQCMVTISANTSVSVQFNLKTTSTLIVNKTGTGSGLVSISDNTLSWGGNTGTAEYKIDTVLTLAATTTTTSSTFASWSGCDSTSGNKCIVTMSDDKVLTATFDGVPEHYNQQTQFGGTGSEQGKFQSAGKMAMNKGLTTTTPITQGRIVTREEVFLYVVDTGNNRIQKFRDDGTSVDMWDGSDQQDGKFLVPEGIDIDDAGDVYIADTGNNRIRKYDKDGKFKSALVGDGTADGKVKGPKGVAVDVDGNIYVADTNNHRVQKFDKHGTWIKAWKASGAAISPNAPMTLDLIVLKAADVSFTPVGISVDDGDDSVYVSDTYTDRIIKYDRNGNFKEFWGGTGIENGRFRHPNSIVVDASGNLYVTDEDNNRVQKFDKHGQFISFWNSGANTNFDRPRGLALDPHGNIFLSEAGSFNRVRKFGPPVSLSIGKIGMGSGTVKSNDGQINCGNTCSTMYEQDNTITLTATADALSAFNGWTGNCSGSSATCNVKMSASKTVTAVFGLATDKQLTVAKSGTGTGKVTSTPSGIDCGPTCSASFTYNTTVILTATADTGYAFAGWSGDCTGSGNTCNVTMSDVRNVTATFAVVAQCNTVTKAGADTPETFLIDMGKTTGIFNFYYETYSQKDQVVVSYDNTTLYDTGCVGASKSLDLSFSGSSSIIKVAVTPNCAGGSGTAWTFTISCPKTGLGLSISKTGTGSGSVTSSPAGIDCGDDCSESYTPGTSVTLTAKPATDSTFTGWSGNCTGTTCTLTMDADKRVTASFYSAKGSISKVRHGSRDDFDRDGKSDIVWQNTNTGDVAAWLMNGSAIAKGDYLAKGIPKEWQIMAIGDIDGDGKSDIVWQNTNTGDVVAWLMNGTNISRGDYLAKGIPKEWQIMAIGDLNGDGRVDIVWQNTNTGDVAAWLMNGSAIAKGDYLAKGIPKEWQIMAIGDLNGDGRVDIVWQNTNAGDVAAWLMDGTNISKGDYVVKGIPKEWQIVAIGDLDGDGKVDITLQNASTGDVVVWLMNGTSIKSVGFSATIPDWQVVATGDLDGDGRNDIIWQNANTGDVYVWFMNGASVTNGAYLVKGIPKDWQVK